MEKEFEINGKPATAEEISQVLPESFMRKVSDERLVELANKYLEGISYNDFIEYWGEWFSMACELLARRANESKGGK